MKRLLKLGTVLFIIVISIASVAMLSSCNSTTVTNVTFMVGDEKYADLSLENGELALPDSPEKVGHDFIGWFLDKDTYLEELNEESFKALSHRTSITVYAKFIALENQVVYVDGGKHSNPSSIPLNTQYSLTDAKKSGYTFKGWYADKNYTSPVTQLFSDKPQVTTLYAKWAPVEYLATFKSNGITIRTVAFNVETSSISEPALPELDGYTAKWESYTLSASNITINAVYTPIVYRITYQNAYGTSNPNPTEYTIESSTIKLSDVKKGSLKFEGWYVGNTLMTEIPAGSYGDIILVAKWDHFMVY